MKLHRVTDGDPGIRRHRTKTGFRHQRTDGKPISRRDRSRIDALVIPPAWTDVWVCLDPKGHIQATGIDTRGRKQYIYHDDWRRSRDGKKFERLEAFGRALPALREAVEADLHRPGLPRQKVVAAVVRIMENSFIRIGSERYAQENRSYGASTLLGEHVEHASWQQVHFRFRGKGGKKHEVDLKDPRVAAVVRRCRELPGQRLFEYEEGGEVCQIGSADVNAYMRDAMGGHFTSKDMRTWSASVLMLHELMQQGPRTSDKQRMRVLRRAVKEVAARMHHTVAISKKSYIHPAVPAAYFDGSLKQRVDGAPKLEGLFREEERLLALLASFG